MFSAAPTVPISVPTEAWLRPSRPRKWCADLRIAEIELGRSDSRLVHRQSRFGLPCRAGALIKSVLGEEAALGERGPAIEVRARVLKRRDISLRLRLCLIQRRLKIAWIDCVEQIAFLDVGTVRYVLLLNEAGYFGLERNVADRFRAGRIVELDRNRFLDDVGNGHWHRKRCGIGNRSSGTAKQRVALPNNNDCDGDCRQGGSTQNYFPSSHDTELQSYSAGSAWPSMGSRAAAGGPKRLSRNCSMSA